MGVVNLYIYLYLHDSPRLDKIREMKLGCVFVDEGLKRNPMCERRVVGLDRGSLKEGYLIIDQAGVLRCFFFFRF